MLYFNEIKFKPCPTTNILSFEKENIVILIENPICLQST